MKSKNRAFFARTWLLQFSAFFSAILLSSLAAQAAPITFSYTGTIVQYTVPVTGIYNITAHGAGGGGVSFPDDIAFDGSLTGYAGSGGATIGGDLILNAGDILDIAVGGRGDWHYGVAGLPEGSGGGGSFVVQQFAGIFSPLVIAGGGGGSGYGGDGVTFFYGGPGLAGTLGGDGQSSCLPAPLGGSGGNGGGIGVLCGGFPPLQPGGGGGGYLTDGETYFYGGGQGGSSFFNGLSGGAGAAGFSNPVHLANGGFGGGGGSSGNGAAGGGGGFSGGGAGNGEAFRNSHVWGGGGGGSFIIDRPAYLLVDDVALDGVINDTYNRGYGSVSLEYVRDVPEPFTLSLLASGLVGTVAVRRRKKKAAEL